MKRCVSSSTAVFLAASVGLLVVGCDDPAAPPPSPATLEIAAGGSQSAEVGLVTPVTPAARVLDQYGDPMTGIEVTFSVVAGGGSITRATAATDDRGVAMPGSWTVGTVVGENRLIAEAMELAPVEFTATGTAGPAAEMEEVEGDEQSADVGAAVPVVPAVRARDRFDNVVPGVEVRFEVTAGGGSVGQATTITDESGIATPGSWTLGTTAGDNTLAAQWSGGTVTFDATGVPGALAELEKVEGDEQSAEVGTELSTSPAVRAQDVYGNPIADVEVSFSVTAGGGSVSGAAAMTGSDGIARVGGWTLGTGAGSNTLAAQWPGGTVAFTATGLPGPPAEMAKVEGDEQSAEVGTEVGTTPTVRVLDQYGNAVSDVEVSFEVTAGGGSVGQAAATTDGDGVATSGSWTLGTTAGDNLLTAHSSAGSMTFSATGTPGPLAELEKTAGDGQSAATGTGVAVPPAVRAQDTYGNPIADVDVTFSVLSGGGSISGATAATASNGVAAVGSWTLGSGAGENTLGASADGVESVTFTATATQASDFDIEIVVIGTMTDSQRAAFTDAVARWEQVIVGDLPDFTGTLPNGGCQPEDITGIDDVVIYAEIESIDGAGGTLGRAGPCYYRSGSGPPFPLTGIMTFDSDDVANLQASGTFTDVVLHEIGHVLGIGTFWDLSPNAFLTGAGGSDPYFTGSRAIAAFDAAGGAARTGNKVPVENTGGTGTRDSHWRESVHDTELMTGYASSSANPLSIITIASLEDMGYTVDMAAADSYTVPHPMAALRDSDPDLIRLVELPPPTPIPAPIPER